MADDSSNSSSITAPLLSSYADDATSVAKSSSTIGVDEMLVRYAGEFGTWQLRHFLLTSLAWALNALHTLVVIFADRDASVGSTVAEWGLVGENKYKVGLARSAFFAGSMIGAGIFGSLSDSFLGRKGTLTITCSMNAASGILTAFSPSFSIYAAFRFLTGISTGGVGLSAFVLTTEPIGPSKRGAVSMFTFCFFSFGTIALSLLARFLTSSWRSLYVVTSLPSLLFVLAVLPFVAESPRWHLVRGDPSAAMKIMRSIAKTNKNSIPRHVTLSLDCSSKINANANANADAASSSSILDVFRSPVTRSRLALAFLINLVVSVVYYGLTLNVGNLGTDLYVGVIVNAVAEMPAYVLTAMLVKRCGRRPLVIVTTWTGAVFCVLAASLAGDGVARTGCGVVGIFAATATFDLVYIYTAELFPTAVRNAALGCTTLAGQIGAVVAPMVVVLGGDWAFAVFGVCGVVGGLLGFGLPETLNRPMYDTMEGMEKGEEEEKLNIGGHEEEEDVVFTCTNEEKMDSV